MKHTIRHIAQTEKKAIKKKQNWEVMNFPRVDIMTSYRITAFCSLVISGLETNWQRVRTDLKLPILVSNSFNAYKLSFLAVYLTISRENVQTVHSFTNISLLSIF